MDDISCDKDGVLIEDNLIARGDSIPWAASLNADKKIMLCKMIHMLAEKQAKTRFIVAQIKQDFDLNVSIEDIEDLKGRFVEKYHITVRERA